MSKGDFQVECPFRDTWSCARCWFAQGYSHPEDNRHPRATSASMYTKQINVDAFQPRRNDTCWECGSPNHRRGQCPVLRQGWNKNQGHSDLNRSTSSSMENQKHLVLNCRSGVTLTKVHNAETNVSTLSAVAVTTRSKATATNQVVEHRKSFLIDHRNKLNNIRKDLQKRLDMTTTSLDIQHIWDDTNATITLSKLLKICPESHKYLQQATLPETRTDPTIIEVNATT